MKKFFLVLMVGLAVLVMTACGTEDYSVSVEIAENAIETRIGDQQQEAYELVGYPYTIQQGGNTVEAIAVEYRVRSLDGKYSQSATERAIVYRAFLEDNLHVNLDVSEEKFEARKQLSLEQKKLVAESN